MASPPPALEILGILTHPLSLLDVFEHRPSDGMRQRRSSRARRLHGVVGPPIPAGHHQPAAETLQDGVQRHLFLHRRCPPPRDGGIGLGHRLRLPHTRRCQVLRALGSPRRRAVAHGGVSADLPEVILAAGEECHGLARRHSCRSLPALPEEHV